MIRLTLGFLLLISNSCGGGGQAGKIQTTTNIVTKNALGENSKIDSIGITLEVVGTSSKIDPIKLSRSELIENIKLPEQRYQIKYESKYFQAILGEESRLIGLAFWDENLKKYDNEISVENYNPYHILVDSSSYDIGYRIFKLENIDQYQKFISSNYPPDYTDKKEPHFARHFIDYEFSNDRKTIKDFFPICYSFEVFNEDGHTLGIETTVVIFSKNGKVYKQVKLDTPIYFPSITNDGQYLGYLIGGEYGEEYSEIIYPLSLILYDLKKNEVVLQDETNFGDPMGGGFVNKFLFHSYKSNVNIADVIIDPVERIIYSIEISRSESKDLRFKKDGYYSKKDGKPVYLFSKHFKQKRF